MRGQCEGPLQTEVAAATALGGLGWKRDTCLCGRREGGRRCGVQTACWSDAGTERPGGGGGGGAWSFYKSNPPREPSQPLQEGKGTELESRAVWESRGQQPWARLGGLPKQHPAMDDGRGVNWPAGQHRTMARKAKSGVRWSNGWSGGKGCGAGSGGCKWGRRRGLESQRTVAPTASPRPLTSGMPAPHTPRCPPWEH